MRTYGLSDDEMVSLYYGLMDVEKKTRNRREQRSDVTIEFVGNEGYQQWLQIKEHDKRGLFIVDLVGAAQNPVFILAVPWVSNFVKWEYEDARRGGERGVKANKFIDALSIAVRNGTGKGKKRPQGRVPESILTHMEAAEAIVYGLNHDIHRRRGKAAAEAGELLLDEMNKDVMKRNSVRNYILDPKLSFKEALHMTEEEKLKHVVDCKWYEINHVPLRPWHAKLLLQWWRQLKTFIRNDPAGFHLVAALDQVAL